MTPPRSALPLPRYVERKPIAAGWAHYWHTPKWAKDAGCPIGNEALGLNYAAAVKRAEEILLPAFLEIRRHQDRDASGRYGRHARLAVRGVSRRSPLHQA